MKIVAAFPGGSPDLPASADRVEGYTKKLAELGVEIVPSIDALLAKVDVVLLESVDGRPHLEQVIPVLKAKKPVFIDKPVAGTLADAVAIFELAKRADTPCFSSSSLRFSQGHPRHARRRARSAQCLGCEARGPCSLEPHHPDLFWYGIHGVETLFTIMGPGCETVSRADRGHRFGRGHAGATAGSAPSAGCGPGLMATAPRSLATRGSRQSGGYDGYEPLVVEIVKFFKTGKPPVSPQRRSRSTPSWKRPTRASAKGASR